MSVTGGKSLERKLKQLSEYGLEKAIANGIQTVRSTAVLLCPVDNGELRQSIMTMVESRGGKVTGTCYTDKAYAIYVEFGTGPKGQQDHAGISPDVAVAYSQSPWWIHESQVDPETARKYRWHSIRTDAGIFYQSYGQPAQPFMYPALKNNEKKLADGIRGDFQAAVRKALK